MVDVADAVVGGFFKVMQGGERGGGTCEWWWNVGVGVEGGGEAVGVGVGEETHG